MSSIPPIGTDGTLLTGISKEEMEIVLKFRKEKERTDLDEAVAALQKKLRTEIDGMYNSAKINKEHNNRAVDAMYEAIENYSQVVRDYIKLYEGK